MGGELNKNKAGMNKSNFPAMSVLAANEVLSKPGSPFEIIEENVLGQKQRVFKNAPAHLPALLDNTLKHSKKTFFIYEKERVTFGANHKATKVLAAYFRDMLNLDKGERVAVIMRNVPQWPVTVMAAMKCGAIATPLNSMWTGAELAYALKDCGARIAVMCGETLAKLKPYLRELLSLETVIVSRGSDGPVDAHYLKLEDIIGDAKSWKKLEDFAEEACGILPDDDAMLFYTSGTTGRPKGALSTHRAVISALFNSLSSQARGFVRSGVPVPIAKAGDPQRVYLISAPFFHTTGAIALLFAVMVRGARAVTQHKWDPKKALALIAKEKINVIGGVPTIVWQILRHPDRKKHDLSSISIVSYGGSPSAAELVTESRKAFPGTIMGNGWGMTETCATCTMIFGDDYLVRPLSAGAAALTIDLQVRGAEGQLLPANEAGELWVRGPNLMREYWKNPNATKAVLQDGWLRTGDIARIDEEGFLFILDRAKDMLIRGGENIYCIEVENCLAAHPKVRDVAIIGVPHIELGEEVGAVVYVAPETKLTAAALQKFAGEHLSAYKVPKHIKFVTQPLPRNESGKVMKPQLAAYFTKTDKISKSGSKADDITQRRNAGNLSRNR
ncbi:class I adenylate-forming enzyme family protein [Hirschia litorea]|uniref:Class I adenylate-forming enzyme family protein n=1 Tax=Hirschia litorea TaxID=1199156 RepID=A0ABW2IIQ5_9PROT